MPDPNPNRSPFDDVTVYYPANVPNRDDLITVGHNGTFKTIGIQIVPLIDWYVQLRPINSKNRTNATSLALPLHAGTLRALGQALFDLAQRLEPALEGPSDPPPTAAAAP